jgi:TRAP-type transport system periplasmic protein
MKPTLLAALFAATIALVLPARADEPIKLKFATLSPGEGPLNQRVLHPWAERVNAQGKGIVEIDVRDGFAIASFDNVYNRVLDDVIQVAFTVTGSIAGKFVRSGVVSMPYLYDRSDDASAAFWRLYKTGGLGSEYDDIVPLFICATANSGFHLTHPPRSPDDLTGFKIVTSSKTAAMLVSALGGTPISFQQSDMYTALQRKTVDGTTGAWTSFPPYKLGEVTSYHIDAGLGGAPAMVFMAKKTFNALPAAVQKVLMDNAGEAQSRAFGAYWQNLDVEVRAEYKDKPGHTTVTLTPAQTAEWKKKLEIGVTERWVKETPGGEATLAAYRSLLADVTAGR